MVGASSLLAQPGSVQKVAKSVFSLTTFNKDGGIIASTQGVFIDNKGTAISTFKPFIGATKATVVDANGKSMEVDAIMGADELYDIPMLHRLQARLQKLATRYGWFPTPSKSHNTSKRISVA